ncbi:MAG: DUF938 domain-containing protein [Thermohalobaculum sp.]|nr:DUF938 domain-containing protein [Thermohalobaculum sp.]
MTTSPRHLSRFSPANVASTPDGRLCSPSFERNFEPIRAALVPLIGSLRGTVLEIGAGTGHHAAHFARAFPGVTWVPSDPREEHRASIAAWRAAVDAPNLAAPLALDAATGWADGAEVAALGPLAAVYAMNVIHIAPWTVACGLVAGAARVLAPGGRLILYGPFAEGGRHTGEGNARFDAALRAENPEWGVRDLGDVAALARDAGLGVPEVTVMPSNNRLVAFARG